LTRQELPDLCSAALTVVAAAGLDLLGVLGRHGGQESIQEERLKPPNSPQVTSGELGKALVDCLDRELAKNLGTRDVATKNRVDANSIASCVPSLGQQDRWRRPHKALAAFDPGNPILERSCHGGIKPSYIGLIIDRSGVRDAADARQHSVFNLW
jgi:hypothetical protein